jgi:hypothetical protein
VTPDGSSVQVWTTVENRGMTKYLSTSGDTPRSTIHNPYNNNTKTFSS